MVLLPLITAVLGCTACASGRTADVPAGGDVGASAAASAALERDLVAATAPDRPLRVRFDWTLRERDGRFRGRGVARLEPPYRARLDLFGPRGETYLSAAIVNGELRMPPQSTDAPVPPPALLWSTLGVLLPPPGAQLAGSRHDGDRVRLEYTGARGRWRFEFERQRLRHAGWERTGGGRHTVELEGVGRFDLPQQAVYRDWAAFRELSLTLDEVKHVEPFPPETWVLGAR